MCRYWICLMFLSNIFFPFISYLFVPLIILVDHPFHEKKTPIPCHQTFAAHQRFEGPFHNATATFSPSPRSWTKSSCMACHMWCPTHRRQWSQKTLGATVDGSEIRLTSWDVSNLANNGKKTWKNYQPQLVSLPDFWTINSMMVVFFMGGMGWI